MFFLIFTNNYYRRHKWIFEDQNKKILRYILIKIEIITKTEKTLKSYEQLESALTKLNQL